LGFPPDPLQLSGSWKVSAVVFARALPCHAHPITSYGRLMDEQFGLFWIHLGFAAIVGLIMLLFVV